MSKKNKKGKSKGKKMYNSIATIDAMKMVEKPSFLISGKAWGKMTYWIDKAPGEISGMGLIKQQANGSYIVTDVILLPQKNGSAHTEIDGQDVAKAMYALRDADGSLNFWWHSHAQMSAFWSAEDKNTISNLGSGGFFFSTVINKRGEHRTAFSLKLGGGEHVKPQVLFIDEIPTRLSTVLSVEEERMLDSEYDKNVTSSFATTSYLSIYNKSFPKPDSGNPGRSKDPEVLRTQYAKDRKAYDYEINRGYRFVLIGDEWWCDKLDKTGRSLFSIQIEPFWLDGPSEGELQKALDKRMAERPRGMQALVDIPNEDWEKYTQDEKDEIIRIAQEEQLELNAGSLN